jgi:hypothetical protein
MLRVEGFVCSQPHRELSSQYMYTARIITILNDLILVLYSKESDVYTCMRWHLYIYFHLQEGKVTPARMHKRIDKLTNYELGIQGRSRLLRLSLDRSIQGTRF